MHSSESSAQDGPDILEVLGRLWSRKWLIVAAMLVFTAAFTALAFLSTPVYRATAVLMPASTGRMGSLGSLGSLGGLASIAGINLGQAGGNQTEEAMAVLRSREFSEAFMADNKLLPVLFADKWNAAGGAWIGGASAQPSMAKAYKKLNKIRVIEEDKKTGLVNLQIDWTDPALAASWANELVARLNSTMKARAIARSTAYVDFLQKELAHTSEVETRTAISRLIEAQVNERVLASVSPDYAFRIVDRATVPDVHDPLWPNKPLLVVLGAITGLVVGCFLALVLHAMAARAARRHA